MALSLQVALLRQYLDYTEASRKRVGRIGFIQAVLRDTTEVIDHGYMQLLDVARSSGMIIILVVWTATRTLWSVPMMLVPLGIMGARLVSSERTALTLRLKCTAKAAPPKPLPSAAAAKAAKAAASAAAAAAASAGSLPPQHPAFALPLAGTSKRRATCLATQRTSSPTWRSCATTSGDRS